ncbi:MAG: NADH-quinone oxidoreductase subunit N [Glaciecola sp.]
MLRLFLVAFAPLQDLWVPVVSVLAAITMLYGAIVAVVQHDLKRMLAYSSIAHAGYAMIGVVSTSTDGMRSTVWYLLTYAVSTLAAFGAVIAIERARQGEVTLDRIRGLGRTSPALAVLFSLALLSLAGIPPTAGFAGKLLVFQAGVDAGLQLLVIAGVISSVIAAFFYLRIMAMMFLEAPREDVGEPLMSGGLVYGISLASALVIYLGVNPRDLLRVADSVAQILR